VARALPDRSLQYAKETEPAFVSLITSTEYHRAQNLYEATLWAKDEECFHQVLISAMPSKAHAVEHNYNNSYDYSTYNS
tara:strand:+ start:97 stop:333 length:237 start_codon:yes stop_codon:yes gene_type:complete